MRDEHTAVLTSSPRLARYQIVGELDRGGMGVVYLAVSTGPGGFTKLVVIKQLLPSLMSDPSCREMFINEARVGAKLTHPNIGQTYEVVCDDDVYFTVMEYLDGPSLHAVLRQMRKRGVATRALYLTVILDVLKALDYAHSVQDIDGRELRVVHRDVTPHNVILTYDGQVKLFDFGIAKAEGSMEQTQAGIIKGKAAYMSPEQAAGEVVDARSDLFTVGVLLWEALTGGRLWGGAKRPEVFHALMAKTPIPSPRAFDPAITPGLEAVCMRALAYEPDARYATARDLYDALEKEVTALGAPMSTRDLAAIINADFAELRAQRRAMIEARHDAAKTCPEEGLAPLPRNSASISSSSAPSGPYGIVVAPPSAPPFPRVGAADGIAPPSSLAPTSVGQATSAPPPPRVGSGSRRWVAVAVVVPLLALGGVGVVVAPRARLSKVVAAARESLMSASPVRAPAAAAPPPSAAPPIPPAATPLPPETTVEITPTVPATGAPDASPRALRPAPAPRSFALPATRSLRAKPIETVEPPPPPVSATPPPAPSPPPPEPAAIKPPEPKPGTLRREQVSAVMRAHASEMRECFDRSRMESPDLTARIGAQIQLSGDGRVTDVATSSNRGGTARLQGCVSSAIRRWTFPAPAGGASGSIAYTFVFD